MGKLRFDCYEDFAKRIEFPVVAFEADTGKVVIMNYEAKLLLGQKTEKIEMSIEKAADANRFWTLLHDRKAIMEHHLIISNEKREFPVMGIVNEFEVDDQKMYMLLFEQRSGFGMNSWLLERIIENSHVIIVHLSFENQEEVKLNYISRNIKQYGYTCEEFYTGKLQFKDIIHPDDLDAVLGGFAERDKDMQDVDCMEYRIVTESRKVCYVRGNVRMIRNAAGSIESMEIVMMDVTGEKLEKDENQYLRAAIEQSRNVVLVKRFLNKKGTVKYVSSNALAIGMDVEDLRKGRKTFTDYVLPEDRQMMTDILMNARNMPVNNYMCKCRIRGEDGVIRWIKSCISVKNIDEYMYDVELLMQDVTEESSYEQNLLQNQKALEEKLDYVMNRQVQNPMQIFEELQKRGEIQELLEAFAENNQLYAVIVNREGKSLTKPTGPMIRLGEFYDMLERPKYHGKLEEALETITKRKKFCILELENNYFEKQIGAIPLMVGEETVAACLICAFDEEAVSRLHNSIESLQKMVDLMVKAEFDNQYLEIDSQKSRLAERTMSEELEGQLILARAFANMRNDADATMQEILEKTCDLLHLTSIAVYYGDSIQESYSCVAKWVVPEAEYKEFPEASWRMAELCRKNEIIANGGYLIYGQDEEDSQMNYLVSKTKSHGMMIFGLVVNEEISGGIMFISQDRRIFREREIAYCQDVADIIQGILVRNRSTGHVLSLNKDLLNAYNFMSDCIFIKDIQTGKVLFANEAMENLFGMDVTGMDSRAFLSEPTPTYTREGIQPIGDIKWQSYIRQVNKIMNIQELGIRWQNGEEAKIIIMRENK
ncbi:MAG: PAS domain-containing protein [Lachnospiraceae bacterium]|nr:PAS domain-containing protein [Lachnospiraceae bacterium]